MTQTLIIFVPGTGGINNDDDSGDDKNEDHEVALLFLVQEASSHTWVR